MKRVKIVVFALMVVCVMPLHGCSLPFMVCVLVPEENGVDETALSALPTEGGGFAMVGSSYSHCSEQGNIYLAGFDADGEELWAKTTGGPDDDRIVDAVISADGAFLVAGTTNSYGHGGNDIYLLKIDNKGEVLWSKAYGDGSDDETWSIAATAEGGARILTSKISLLAGQEEWALMTIDTDGAVRSETPLALPNIHEARKLRACANGDLVLLIKQVSEGYYYQDALVRVDAQGVVLWTQTFPYTALFQDVTPCREGGFALMGTFESPYSFTRQLYLYRVDENGAALWANVYSADVDIEGYAVTECANGDFVLCGWDWWSGEAVVVRADAAGAQKWDARFGGDDFEHQLTTLQELSDDTLILSGRIRERSGDFWGLSPQSDAYLLHLDAEGVELMSAVSGEKRDDGECVAESFYQKEADAE
jgi:hypothetical protein